MVSYYVFCNFNGHQKQTVGSAYRLCFPENKHNYEQILTDIVFPQP